MRFGPNVPGRLALPVISALDPFLTATAVVFLVALLVIVGLYVRSRQFPRGHIASRVVQRFVLPAAGLALLGLLVSVLSLYGLLGSSGSIIAWALLVALFAYAGYAAFYFYRVFPQQAARWRAEEARRQYIARPKSPVVSRQPSRRKSRKRR